MNQILVPYTKPDGPRAGYFGKCGKMIIKPYSIPENMRDRHLEMFLR